MKTTRAVVQPSLVNEYACTGRAGDTLAGLDNRPYLHGLAGAALRRERTLAAAEATRSLPRIAHGDMRLAAPSDGAVLAPIREPGAWSAAVTPNPVPDYAKAWR